MEICSMDPEITISNYPYFFLIFFPILLPFLHPAQPYLPYMEIYYGPWNHHQQLSLFFSDFFPHFIAIFTSSTAIPSIYGNMPWTLKSPSATIPIFFWFFSYFIAIFTCSTAIPSIYGNIPWTLKSPSATTPILFWFFPILFWFFSHFFTIFRWLSKSGKTLKKHYPNIVESIWSITYIWYITYAYISLTPSLVNYSFGKLPGGQVPILI